MPLSKIISVMQASFPRESHNPLPQWLATTFSRLSPEHPLRLLLPYSERHESEMSTTVMAPSDPEEQSMFHDPQEDSVFAFNVTDCDSSATLIASAGEEYLGKDVSEASPLDLYSGRTFLGSSKDLCSPAPFSTRGPSFTLSAPIIQPAPVLNFDFSSILNPNADTMSLATGTSPQELLEAKPSYSLHETPFELDTEDISATVSNAILTKKVAYTQPFADIFATPGPCNPVFHTVYFDSPAEDPISDKDVDYDALDFHWEPFDRKGHPKFEADRCRSAEHPAKMEPLFFQRCFDTEYPADPRYFDFSLAISGSSRQNYGATTASASSPSSIHELKRSSSAFTPVSRISISPLRRGEENPYSRR